MGKRSRQSGPPTDAQTEQLRQMQQQLVGGWKPSVQMLMTISQLIKLVEAELGLQSSKGDDRRLAQRLVSVRNSGLAIESADGLSDKDYDTCVLAAERHFLGAGYGIEDFRDAMTRVVRPRPTGDRSENGSRAEGETKEAPSSSGATGAQTEGPA
ncbi:unnamed protein product [Symbiodinium sp. CCMP2592]|nr:unnamed protein product [Symbiodinium sp. CCMP2592]